MSATGPRREELPSDAVPVVLVVEDEVLVRMVIAQYLRDCGFQVVEASNADEAIRVIQLDASINVVFSDINMPGSRNGFELAQWLRQERPSIKVLLTSGVPQMASAAGNLCEDGPLVSKPYDPQSVERRIRMLLAC